MGTKKTLLVVNMDAIESFIFARSFKNFDLTFFTGKGGNEDQVAYDYIYFHHMDMSKYSSHPDAWEDFNKANSVVVASIFFPSPPGWDELECLNKDSIFVVKSWKEIISLLEEKFEI